jgi:hypothetical protein
MVSHEKINSFIVAHHKDIEKLFCGTGWRIINEKDEKDEKDEYGK